MPSGHKHHPTKTVEKKHCAFEDLDHAILQEPLNLGVTDIKQILKCVQSGSREVKDLILNECSLIYECKLCQALFRSLANFMYHKRCYCKKHVCEKMVLFQDFDPEEPQDPVLVHPEAPEELPEKQPEAETASSKVLPKMMECTVELVKADVPDHIPFPESSTKTPPAIPENVPEAESVPKQKATERISKQKAAKVIPKPSSTTTESVLETPTSAADNVPEAPSPLAENVPETASPIEENILETASPVAENGPEIQSMVTEETPRTPSMSPETPTDVPKCASKGPNASTKEPQEQGASKGKNKPPAEKKVVERKKAEYSMVSRRTRDKSSQQISNAHKLPVESSSDEEPPSKMIKTAPKDPKDDKPASVSEKSSSTISSPSKNDIQETNETPIKCTIAKGSLSPSFPKFVLKPIPCQSNSMLKNSDRKKAENIAMKNLQNFPMQTKLDNNKLVIVLKKKESSSGTPEAKTPLGNKQRSESQKINEFHLTRRKRLMSRNDCNVHELKCLICKTQFMSLKTLYFHMLSLHSKKRLYYPCPFCKTLFVQMYGVTRHLISIHNKTKEQINKLRDVIKKKSVWKRVDDSDLDSPEKPRQELGIESYPLKPDDEPTKPDEPARPIDSQFEVSSTESSPTKTVIKIGKNSALHACSKCNRVFGRKSSQVSHEKFCIMNAIKVDTVERSPSPTPTPPIRPTDIMPVIQRDEVPLAPSPTLDSIRISARPKRGAEKLMHKDFVNSQTLKWRSANRIETNNKLVPKKTNGKGLEKKVLTIMDAENLSCTKCDKKFSSFSNLRRHIAIHVGWTRFKCKHCDYQAYNKSQCWAHVQKAHPSSDADIEKSIVHLSGGNSSGKKSSSEEEEPPQKMKRSSDTTKWLCKSTIPKIKVPKKKNSGPAKSSTVGPVSSLTLGPAKDPTVGPVRNLTLGPVKSLTLPKKSITAKKESLETRRDSLDGKKENRESKKDGIDGRKDAREGKKDVSDNKKDAGRKDGLDGKGKKDGSDGKRDVREAKKDFSDGKKDAHERREKKPALGATSKICVPEYKKEINYKSMTTSNPTTIILSKRIPTSAVQSIVTISPGSVSPVRSSPRKNEIKFPEIKQLPKLQGLVTRSAGPPHPAQAANQVRRGREGRQSEKTYARKDRLISEWFPKKDLNSNNTRRESAPVIIGLVPASGSGLTVRTKSPIAFDAMP
ncbi:LOW QUALITY PROTEIN: zinc finger protein 800-like [Uloborus diversus]|uniref:LOW QUALITY PROTEIN: zinc finger protein 800-like n=1 Tax=Uloborus diversus TaxID=327109 RepID=UPI00240A6CE5|nr:LOW QUALITY PROTEIN: zinc finger protein 800-like [Uloborus diversus]